MSKEKAEEQEARAKRHRDKAAEYDKTDAPSNRASAEHHRDKANQAQSAANIWRKLLGGK